MEKCQNRKCKLSNLTMESHCELFDDASDCTTSIIKQKSQCETCKNYKPVKSDLETAREYFVNTNDKDDSAEAINYIIQL